MIKHIIITLLVAMCWQVASAQDEDFATPDSDEALETAGNTSITDFFKPGGWSADFYIGSYESSDEPQFTNLRADFSIGVGLSVDLNSYSHLGLDIELFDGKREFDTPVRPGPLSSIDNDTKIITTAFLAGVRAFFPAEGSLRMYASTGLGFFSTRMVVYGSVFGLPASMEDTERNMGLYYGAGFSYMFGNWGLSLNYRHFNLDGSFGSFNVTNVDLGGDLLLAGLRYDF